MKVTNLDTTAGKDLLNEARASSSLTHPNICTIYEVGETNGELYIVMELVEGKSLRAMIGETGLPAASVLRYGVQIAGALSASSETIRSEFCAGTTDIEISKAHKLAKKVRFISTSGEFILRRTTVCSIINITARCRQLKVRFEAINRHLR